jgi:hypothetical protein
MKSELPKIEFIRVESRHVDPWKIEAEPDNVA